LYPRGNSSFTIVVGLGADGLLIDIDSIKKVRSSSLLFELVAGLAAKSGVEQFVDKELGVVNTDIDASVSSPGDTLVKDLDLLINCCGTTPACFCNFPEIPSTWLLLFVAIFFSLSVLGDSTIDDDDAKEKHENIFGGCTTGMFLLMYL
jgi:hypothetical protein